MLKNKKYLILFVLALLLLAAIPLSRPTRFSALSATCTDCTTATPVGEFDNSDGTNDILVLRDNGTPVWTLNDGGDVVASGGQSGLENLVVSAPTAIGTATPAALINSAGGVSNLLEVRDSSTPVFTINDGGAWLTTGAGTHSSGQTVNDWMKVAVPTDIATATPGVVIDSAGVSNILEVRDVATPVFAIRDGGVHEFLNGELTLSTTTFDMNDTLIDQDLGVENLGQLPTVCSLTITYTVAAGGTGTVCSIGAGEIWYIHAVFAEVTTDFDASGDDALVEIGDGGDTDGLLDLDDAELQAADTEGTGAPAGWQGFMSTDTRGAYLANGHGFIYSPAGAETIDYIIDETSGETLTAGELTVYVIYTRLQ